ncbi:MAG: NRDE family protein [Microbacterium sp.]|uniref:NRDE family protein n=1 Tax=Microbacterium sp. TaxID=51671 RepID=UPI0039E50553
MCTVVIRVPDRAGDAVRLLAVRDEDPGRPWLPLGESWPDTHPGVVGVRDVRAGGAWLAAAPASGRLAVLLNRADVSDRPESELVSRGGIVLTSVAGSPPAGEPPTHGFNLVEVDGPTARVTVWDGARLHTTELEPGTHMLAHDDVDDPGTARIARWLGEFRDAVLDGDRWWAPWLGILARSAELSHDDDRTIIRDNRAFGYPTLSTLLCAATVSPTGLEVRYAELAEPGAWNDLAL